MPGATMTGLAAKSSGSSSDDSQSKAGIFLFGFAVVLQLLDFFYFGFLRVGDSLTLMIIGYFILATMAAVVFRKEGHWLFNFTEWVVFLFISAIYIAIPMYLSYVPDYSFVGVLTLKQIVTFILIIFPVWPIYIGNRLDIKLLHLWVNGWIVILLVAFVLGFALQINPAMMAAIGARSEAIDSSPIFIILDQLNEVWNKLTKTATQVNFFDKLYNLTGLNYYTGMNENDPKEPVGLYIDRVRLADNINYVGSPVTIWVDLSGKSFTQEIRANTFCYIEKGQPGIVDPASFTIFGAEHPSFSCEFDGLKKGSYRASTGVSFDFETWGYVTYAFVDQETSRAYETQGKDVRSELKIAAMPKAIYTNGPVMLGMGTMIDQPVLVDKVKNSRDTILGVTLDNQASWTEGKINSVQEIVLMIPQDFELRKCDRGGDNPRALLQKSENGYDFYSFNSQVMNSDPRLSYQSLTCWVHIKDPNNILMGAAQKVEKTFVSQVKYKYTLEKKIGVTVRE
jgi:hypothetical protein